MPLHACSADEAPVAEAALHLQGADRHRVLDPRDGRVGARRGRTARSGSDRDQQRCESHQNAS